MTVLPIEPILGAVGAAPGSKAVPSGLLERGLLWYASTDRLRRLIHVEGEVDWAERHPGQAVMWLVPHFLALDVAGVATQLFQHRAVASVYQAQSDAVFDAAMRRGRSRFGRGALFARQDTARPLLRADLIGETEGMAGLGIQFRPFVA